MTTSKISQVAQHIYVYSREFPYKSKPAILIDLVNKKRIRTYFCRRCLNLKTEYLFSLETAPVSGLEVLPGFATSLSQFLLK